MVKVPDFSFNDLQRQDNIINRNTLEYITTQFNDARII